MLTTYDEAVAHAKTLNSDFVWIVTKDHVSFAAVPDEHLDAALAIGWDICGSVAREHKVLTMFTGVQI